MDCGFRRNDEAREEQVGAHKGRPYGLGCTYPGQGGIDGEVMDRLADGVHRHDDVEVVG